MKKYKNEERFLKRYKNAKSADHAVYLKKRKGYKRTVLILQICIFVAFFGLWELFTQMGILDAFFVSSPSRMYRTLVDLIAQNNLWTHVTTTLLEAILGFVIATGLGYIIAVGLWSSKLIRNILEPYIVILNSLPKIALGPIIIVWFGVGTKSIVVMAILILIIVTILSMLGAFLDCDKDKILLMQSLGANKMQILTKLIIPSSIPEFISVLKINVGLTWVGTIMGEYLVSKAGLGYLIVYGGTVFKLDLVMTSTMILCILAGVMYFVVVGIEKKYGAK